MIPLMKSAFLHEYDTKQKLAEFIVRSPRLSMDRMCLEFEEKFAAYQGRRFCVLFNSGGSANLALLQSLLNLGTIHRGDTVGFSALTWSTNTMPIIQLGCVPVPIDCRAETLNVMWESVLSRHRDYPLKVMFVTNALGFVGDLSAIREGCREHRIVMIEDNCEALGTRLPEGRAGNFGLAATFSFFVAHHMSTIEGGAACTDDADLDTMLRMVRANGWDRNLSHVEQSRLRKMHCVTSEFDAKYTFYDLAYNFRPTEITGFLGIEQLRYLESNCLVREANYRYLEEAAAANDDLVRLNRGHIEFLSSFAYPVVCRTPELRERYLAQFAGAGVEIRPMIAGNIQRQPFYRKYVGTEFALPGAEFLHECGFYCGNYPELTRTDLGTLRSCLSKC